MPDNQGSARVTLNELDLSQVRDPQQLPQGVPAAVVGSAKRGPAFVPKTFATIRQFEETFGSLSEMSKESNANRFGPLALNEWMRNAQAGTFLRVLGVGSSEGRMNSDKTVEGAGFVVGEKVSHNAEGKLQDNPFAQIVSSHSEGAKLAARTHFLGCFMKDEGESTFLQDAGLVGDDSPAEFNITFESVPENNSYIEIIGLEDNGTTTSKTFGFKNDGTAITDQGDGVTVVAQKVVDTDGLDPAGVATALKNLIINAANGFNDLITVTDDTNGVLTLTQSNVGESGNTQVKAKLSNSTPDSIIVVGSTTIKNSLPSQTIKFREGVDGVKSTINISVNNANGNPNADENDTLTIQSIGVTGVVSGTSTISFVDLASAAANYSDSEKAAGYKIFGVGAANVITGDSGNDTLLGQKVTLSNLVSALNDSNLSNTYNNGLRASLSSDGLTATITQGFAGTEGNIATIVEALAANSFSIGGNLVDGSNTENFANGAAADNASITLTFSDQPNLGDSIGLPDFTTANGSEEFKFVADSNGEDNGDLDTGVIKVELGDNLSITLENLKNAIHLNTTAVIDDDDVLVTVNGGVVNIKSVGTGLRENLDAILKLKGTVSASNPQGDSFICNFGQKLTSFAGGDSDSAAPVIRGLLMTPQGVLPSLDLTSAEYTSLATPLSAVEVANNNTSLKAYPALAGYQLGKVDIASDQSFTLLLNGFKSDDEANVLTCSFNPESANYFAKVLNTDPLQIESRGHYLYAHWDIDSAVAKASTSGVISSSGAGASEEFIGFCMPTAGNPRVSAASKPDFESFDTRFRTASSPWFVAQSFDSTTNQELFKLHALDDGAVGGDRFRILVSNLKADSGDSWGSFDLTLEAFDSDPVKGEPLITWRRLSLDPDSRNFIGRVIGDMHMYYDFDRPTNKQRLVQEGDYEVRNPYVRVELANAVKTGEISKKSLPFGFKGYRTLNTDHAALFAEKGTDGSGTSSLLSTGALDSVKVTPLPFVKSITKTSGATQEPSESISWGVKFAKKQNAGLHQETGEIRFNPSMHSWTKFFPDMDGDDSFGVDSSELFTLERISVADPANIDWKTSIYERNGSLSSMPRGFIDPYEASKSSSNVRYLKFRCLMQGGFDGVNIFNKDKAELTSAAAHREFNEEVSSVYTGPTVETYKRAIDVLKDKSAVEFQLLAIPGMRAPIVTDYALTACETRFDAMLLLDVEEVAADGSVILSDDVRVSVDQTISRFSNRLLNSSFGAAYFPDVMTRRPSTRAPLQVPPSVCMLGAMSRSDFIADPWFAPAGINRGQLNSVGSKVQMNRDLLNKLYDADINPIYEPAGRRGSVFAFGQKTLLEDSSALDRINVRRLLIDIRRKVKSIANTMLFEPNRASTLARFSSLVEPIMADVQARQGVERYKVQIDTTTTTQNDVENNTIRGKIYLQPTKSIEFISLDFVVTNSID